MAQFAVGANSKTFNATTGTPLAGLHSKERFFDQGGGPRPRIDRAPSRSCPWRAREHGVPPAYRFRRAVQAHQPRRVCGPLEAEETYFRQS